MSHLRRWWHNFTYKLIAVKCGPVMAKSRGDFIFIDAYGTTWLLKPSMDRSYPLVIQKVLN